MDRRKFLGFTLAGVTAGIITPTVADAANKNMAGGIFYTEQNPGRWSKKIAGHLPNIDVKRVNGVAKVTVTTAHGMDSYKHYIVKHVLLDENYNFLDEKMFDPAEDKTPISNFTLKSYSGRIYALSMCNKHDVWLSSARV